MFIRHPFDVEQIVMARHFERFDTLADDWDEEGSEAAVAGNPRRAWYLQQMAARARDRAQEVAWGVWEARVRALGLTL